MPSPEENGDPKSSIRPAIGFLFAQANVPSGDHTFAGSRRILKHRCGALLGHGRACVFAGSRRTGGTTGK